MTKWYAAAAILVVVVVACGDSDGGDAAAAVPSAAPPITATATRTQTATATAQPSGGPTLAQLRRALLAEDELGRGWLELDAGELERRYPAVHIDVVNLDTEAFLSVALHDARNGVPDYLALNFLDGSTVNQLTQVAPTGSGPNGVRYQYHYDEDGERVYGEVVAWRQGQAVVAIQVEGTEADVCVCDYAKRQYEKLAAVMR